MRTRILAKTILDKKQVKTWLKMEKWGNILLIPGDGTSNPDPRSGIGNVFNPGDPKDSDLSKHPSDTINELCRLDPNNDACNPNP